MWPLGDQNMGSEGLGDEFSMHFMLQNSGCAGICRHFGPIDQEVLLLVTLSGSPKRLIASQCF